jgi:hypothetical protein
MEIGTSNRVPTMPFVVQPIIKPVSPLRGGTSLEIIPSFVLVTMVVSQPIEGSERFNKKHVELVNPSFTILDNRLESLEFLSFSVPLTPH